MEPKKRARYSKRFDAQEIEEILMEEESDEDLELNEFFEPGKNISSSGNEAAKPHVTEDCNAHMGFVDKSDRMVNSYGIARTWKWTKKLFFHLLDMANLMLIYCISHVVEK
jgi:hypothetical protein